MHTRETKEKMSKAMKKMWASGVFENRKKGGFKKGHVSIFKGKKRPNISKALKGKKMPWVAETNKKLKRGFQKGHPGYFKGEGKTEINKLERQRFRREIQAQVFKRDNYTCQLCGVTNCNLQVDHIQSWAEYVKLKFDMKNCRTLCTRCHYKITFGKSMPKEVKTWGFNLSRGGAVPF